MRYIFGLCEGRHTINDVDKYIFNKDFFQEESSMFDYNYMETQVANVLSTVTKDDILTVYVTGLTTALVEVIKYCSCHNITLELMHFNRVTNTYNRQDMF